MNHLTKRNYLAALFNILIAAMIFLVHYTPTIDISFFNISPMTLLPFVVAFSMHYEELSATIGCTVIGIFADSILSGSSCFHTILFFILGFAISLMLKYLLNNNLKCAIMLCFLASVLYFVLRWVFFHAFTGMENSIEYLLQSALPSVLYTTVFIIPFYYLERVIYRFKMKGGVK